MYWFLCTNLQNETHCRWVLPFARSQISQQKYIVSKSLSRLGTFPNNYWSSRPEVFLRKGVLKICGEFTREHSCRSAIPIKLNHISHIHENSKMFNKTSKYFSLFNNKPPTSWVAHITREFLWAEICKQCVSLFLIRQKSSRNWFSLQSPNRQ